MERLYCENFTGSDACKQMNEFLYKIGLDASYIVNITNFIDRDSREQKQTWVLWYSIEQPAEIDVALGLLTDDT